MEACEKVAKKTQMSIAVSIDYYKQAHMQQSSLSSMALGVMTSTVF